MNVVEILSGVKENQLGFDSWPICTPRIEKSTLDPVNPRWEHSQQIYAAVCPAASSQTEASVEYEDSSLSIYVLTLDLTLVDIIRNQIFNN